MIFELILGNRRSNANDAFKTIFLFWILSILISGCSADENYYKEFDYIKTDQFIWSYGRGGIYWVSENNIVLDAVIENKKGFPERGIYQVNVLNGKYVKLVDLGFKDLYEYCFDGDTLYLTNRSGEFRVVNHNVDYKLIKRKSNEAKDYRYSELRCGFYKDKLGYKDYALLQKDGYLLANISPDRNSYKDLIGEDLGVYLINDKGAAINVDLKSGIVFKPRYLVDRDMYFGYQQRGRCGYFWWLERGSWEGETEKKCFGSWAKHNSLVFIPSRAGLFIEHHAMEGIKTYISVKDNLYPLESISARGSSLAPDGCRIVYGSGDYRVRKNEKDFRQKLKVFDACEFILKNYKKKIKIPEHINRHN